MSFEYTITVKDVYGTDTPEIPEGWELTGEFRPWRSDDYFLDSVQQPETASSISVYPVNPRLILRRKKVRKVIFTEIRQNSQPTAGEWFLDISGRFDEWTDPRLQRGQYFSSPPTTIYRREEVEE